MAPLPDKLTPFKTIFSGYFLKFLTEQVKSKLFCMVRVHDDFLRFVNYWENGLKVGQFVREGAIVYLTPCITQIISFYLLPLSTRGRWVVRNIQKYVYVVIK